MTIGNYQVTAKLGEGGMGSVYLAEHPLIGKKVALKVLHAEFASNQDVVTRFFNEAKAVNDIQHPNIVDIVDYGMLNDGHGQPMVYFIMEFLDGNALADVIRNQSPLSPERALSICLQIADALGASHHAGIIHRDLKPDNVILITRGREADFAKVLDFGIAKLTGDHPGSRRTRTGIVMGTPAYMSPEQCEGRGNIDHRTDVYALGVVLYEMLTGRVPFQGEGYGEVLVQHLTQPPTRPSTIRGVIPPHVEAIVLKALEKHPDLRFPTMEEFMKALADPVGFVEMHGGLQGFLQMPLMATATAPPISLKTPTRIAPLTPAPGQLGGLTTPLPGTLTTPTTLGGGAGEMEYSPSRSRAPLIAGVAVAVLAIAGGGYFLLGKKNNAQPVAAAAGETGDNGNAAGGETPPPVEPPVAPPVEAPVEVPVETPPEPPKAEMVQISVESTPKGADVFVGDETEPRGQTPFKFETEKNDQEIKVTLKADGYEDKIRTLKPNKNLGFDLALRKDRASSKTSSSKGTSSKGSSSTKGSGSKGSGTTPAGRTGRGDDTLNPFGE